MDFLAGTAGHIDHGKSALIRALTGIETDRWQEEKRRGISIDIGFAHMKMNNGATVSFIDAPGHERFIKNMLAGVTGVRAVMLIVAADEGVKPQTREHFEICNLLAIQHGFVVLTKCDLANSEQMQRTREEVYQLCHGSFLDNLPIVETSALTGVGIDDVRRELRRISEALTPLPQTGIARLSVDRSFSVKGHGTVVTGTLADANLRVGDSVLLHPGGRQLRVRGLQVHGNPVVVSNPGERTAVNLAPIDAHEIERGHLLTNNPEVQGSSVIAVALNWISELSGKEVLVHFGAAEFMARIIGLSSEFAYLRLRQPVIAFPGDRMILRQPSPQKTVAGAIIVDPVPNQRAAKKIALNRLKALYPSTLPERVRYSAAEKTNGRSFKDLINSVGLSRARITGLVANDPTLRVAGEFVIPLTTIENHRARLSQWLSDFHARNPNAQGAPLSAAKQGMTPEISTLVFESLPGIRISGDIIALASHKPAFSDADRQMMLSIEKAFRDAAFTPPDPAQVLQQTGNPSKARAMLETLIKAKRLARISSDLIFHADAITRLKSLLATHKGRTFSVPEFKEWTNISRKYAIPLLEFLDREHVTRRNGDRRIVL